MDDPKVGVSIPAVRWLPLYHGFVYDGCGLGYRVVSDSKIEILHLDSPLKIPKEFPYKDYPSAFLQFSVKICDTKFNAKDPKQALEYSGIFGFDWVPESNRAKMYKFLAKEFRADQWMDPPPEPPESFEELAKQFERPFMQGRPNSKCPNSKCLNHAVAGKMHILALVMDKPAPGVSLWGEWGEE